MFATVLATIVVSGFGPDQDARADQVVRGGVSAETVTLAANVVQLDQARPETSSFTLSTRSSHRHKAVLHEITVPKNDETGTVSRFYFTGPDTSGFSEPSGGMAGTWLSLNDGVNGVIGDGWLQRKKSAGKLGSRISPVRFSVGRLKRPDAPALDTRKGFRFVTTVLLRK